MIEAAIFVHLFSSIERILENLFHKWKVSFLEKVSLLHQRQFGWTSKYSKVHILTTLTKDLIKSIDEEKINLWIIYWPLKGLWYIKPCILLKKLKFYQFGTLLVFLLFNGKKSTIINLRNKFPTSPNLESISNIK